MAEWLCPIYMCVFTHTYECAHVSISVLSQACGLHGDFVDPGHFCPHRVSLCMNLSVHVCTDMGKHELASGWRYRYFLISKDELRPMESPPSPAPLLPYPLSPLIHSITLPASPLWASPPPPVFHPLSISPGLPLCLSQHYSTPHTSQGFTSHSTHSLAPPSNTPPLCW